MAGAIRLRQFAPARRLFAPLWFDLDPHSQPLTWRALTVARTRKAQPADVAVGYRVAIGKQQWLVYRSLAAAANRTVLGHNLSTATLVAAGFARAGEWSRWSRWSDAEVPLAKRRWLGRWRFSSVAQAFTGLCKCQPLLHSLASALSPHRATNARRCE